MPVTQPAFTRPPTTPLARIGRRDNKDGTPKTPAQFWVPNDWHSTRRLDDTKLRLYRPEALRRGIPGYVGTFGYRFDDPGAGYRAPLGDDELFRMFYCGETVMGAACETLAGKRAPMYAWFVSPTGTGEPGSGDVNEAWCETRAVGFTRLSQDLLFVDLTANDTMKYLRTLDLVRRSCEMYGIADVNLPNLQGDCRCFTQDVARALFADTGGNAPIEVDSPAGKGIVAGINYLSKHAAGKAEIACWALFDTRLDPGSQELLPCVPISLDHSKPYADEIRAAAEYLDLSIED